MVEKTREDVNPANEQPPAPEAAPPVYHEARPVRREQRERRGYRSLFWPLVLIGLGVLWLLGNLGVIGMLNLSVLAKLWPIALIAVGLDVLVGRRSPLLGGLIGVVTVGLLIALVIAGPALGLASAGTPMAFGAPIVIGAQELKHATFDEAVNGAQDAQVTIDMGSAPTTIDTLSAGSDTLFHADVDYVGEMIFHTSGEHSRSISLSSRHDGVIGINLPVEERWDVELNPDVPTNLKLDVGSGYVDANLRNIALTGLDVDGGSGRVDLELPAADAPYDTSMDVGSGGMHVSVADDAQVDFDVNGGSGRVEMAVGSDADVTAHFDLGSGSTVIDVPSGAAVRLIVEDSGSGGLNAGAGLEQVDDGGDDERNTGTWQTPGYDRADSHILIVVDSMGSGRVSVE